MKYDDLYTYYEPSTYLSTFFDCFYQIRDRASNYLPREHYVYPDGYPEIIINLGSAYCREDLITGKKEIVPGRTCIVIGQKIRSYKIFTEDSCDIISLKLKPYGLYFLSGFPQSNILNKTAGAMDIFGSEIKELIRELVSVDDDTNRMLIIQEFFENKEITRQDDRGLVKIVDFIFASKGILKIESICDHFDVTPRTLENHFNNYIGMSPKEFCAIIQFNNFMIGSFLQKQTFTEIALDCGYYDQAHLIRRFKSFTNTTPRKRLRDLNLLNGINMDILQRQLLAG